MPDAPDLEAAVEFAENPEPRCPCVLLLDTSGSMQGEPLVALAAGLATLRDELRADSVAARRVELAVVTFDSEVRVVQEFTTVDRFEPPPLRAQGLTCMAAAIERALDLLEARKAEYRAHDIAYYRPWIFLITDGEPQGEPEDRVAAAARRVREAEAAKRVAFFAVGVEGANLPRLAELSVRAPLKLKGLDFRELFVWLSRSMRAVAQSRVGEQVPLAPAGWAEI